MTDDPRPPEAGRARRRWPAVAGASLVLLAVVAVAAFVSGPAARAGRAYGRGVEALEAGRYAEAERCFAEARALAPGDDAYRLAGVEAGLRAWEPARLARLRTELDALAEGGGPAAARARDLIVRADAALRETHAARALARAGRDAAALAALERAAAAFPESRVLRAIRLHQQAVVAFAAKDYEGYLGANREAFALDPGAPHLAADVAAGLACRYAAGGGDDARRQALEMLATAERLAREGAAGDRELVAEAAERIRHRLETREILTKAEYDRRFRK